MYTCLFLKKEVLYFCNRVWKAASVTQVFRSGVFHAEDSLKDVSRKGEKLPYLSSEDFRFMQKKAQSVGTQFAVMKHLADPVNSPETLSESAENPTTCERLLLHAFMGWVHSTFPVEDAP